MSDSKLIENLGVSRDVAEAALEMAVKNAMCNYFHFHECDVDIDIKSKTATLFFGIPQKMEIEEAQALDSNIYFCDSLPVTLDFASLPKPVVDNCRLIFPRILEEMKALDTYKLWKGRVHKVVEGVITDVAESWIEVDLAGQTGIMRKGEWIPKESRLYRRGRVFLFYVLKATLKKGIVQVFLSRHSINFPSALLKQKIPWIKFSSIRRYPGQKSWIHTSSMDQFVKNAAARVRDELSGEIVELILHKDRS